MAITNITLDNTSIIEGSPTGTLVGNITIEGSNVDHSVLYLNDYNQFTLDKAKLVVSNGIGLNYEPDEPVIIPVTIGAFTRNVIQSTEQLNFPIISFGIIEVSGVYYNTIETDTTIDYLQVDDVIIISDTNNSNGNYIVKGIINPKTIYVDLITNLNYTDASISTVDIDNITYNKITASLIGQLSVGTIVEITGTAHCNGQYEIKGIINLNTIYIDLIPSYVNEELTASVHRILPITYVDLITDASISTVDIDNIRYNKITASLIGKLTVGTIVEITGTAHCNGQYVIKGIINLNTIYIDLIPTYIDEELTASVHRILPNTIGSVYIPYLAVTTDINKLAIDSIETEIIDTIEYSKIVTYSDHNLHVGDDITIIDTKHCNGNFTVIAVGNANTIYLNPINTFTSQETSGYVYLSDSASHYLNQNDPITIKSTLKINGDYTVLDILSASKFIIPILTSYMLSDSYEIIPTESHGYVYTSELEVSIQITVENAIYSNSVITSVSPIINKIGTFPEITITGTKFTEGGSPIIFLNGIKGSSNYTNPTLIYSLISQLSPGFYNISNLVFPDGSIPLDILNNIRQDINSYSDTTVKFTLVDDLTFGVYDLTVVNGYEQTQLQSNPLYEEDLVSINFIRYTNDKAVSYSLGNTNCYVKPTIQLVYDTDGASGKYGSIMSVIPPNVYMTYLNIYLKHNADFDFSVGGEVVLDNISLRIGDLVWLSNQSESSENGIYMVDSGAWTPVPVVDKNTFIDLGARATDQIDGNITRNIIIDQNITFGKTGFYSITYYVLNSLGILSKAIRKVKILASTASISPSDSYKVTDYLIKSEADSQLLTSGAYSSDNESSACCKPGSTSGEYINKNGTVTFIANQSMGGYKLTNLGNAVSDTDAVNLGQVKSLISLNNVVGSIQTAGETIHAFQSVYINTDGRVYVAYSDDMNSFGKVIGIAESTKYADEPINIISFAKLSGLSSLHAGSHYYVSDNGQLTWIIPTTGFIQIMGIAISTSEFMLLMQPPIGLEQ